MKASTEQKASLLPVGEGYNFLSIKVGEAKINILGEILSGGSVSASTSVLINASASNTSLAMWFIPLGVAIAVTDSKVILGEDAKIEAGSDVLLSAASDITIKNIATMGTLCQSPRKLTYQIHRMGNGLCFKGRVIHAGGIVGLVGDGADD